MTFTLNCLTFRIAEIIKHHLLHSCAVQHLCTDSCSRANMLPSNVNVLHDELVIRDFPWLWSQSYNSNVGVVVTSQNRRDSPFLILPPELYSYMKVQKVYLLQQSQSLAESHPVPAQTLPSYKNFKGRATEVPSLENQGWQVKKAFLSQRNSPYPPQWLMYVWDCSLTKLFGALCQPQDAAVLHLMTLEQLFAFELQEPHLYVSMLASYSRSIQLQ